MNATKKSAGKNAKRVMACVVAIMFVSVAQLACGQDPTSKPFVLKPVSPSDHEPALPDAGFLPITEQPFVTQGLPASRSLGNGNLMPPPLEPVPAGKPALRGAVPGSIAPNNMRHNMRHNMRPGETIYIGPDGQVMFPSHVYRSGRVYRVAPSRKNVGKNNKNKKTPPRPKIDYSLAPIQPAIRPRLGLKDAHPAKVASKTRVVDAAPLFRQKEVVSADRPRRKATAAKPSPATRSNNTPWLTGVRRLMDGNRSAASRSPDTNCPKCGNRKSHVSVASKPSSSVRK